jgi:hypothetical protein
MGQWGMAEWWRSIYPEEKAKTHKTWYTSLYNKLFGGTDQK